ncbi:hypothetical protein BD309DRAFT_962095 [Dichomitus squalens]|uniref:Uncharacterized protein n=1 Tax=Dichomitus squalens TaxID=114155 RepID=A0A4Q9PE81_9APHY|nr:hypothetical protein BD309DRAFT_962095 [Dichomitus squalens]TBU53200.1 hypothetical protein BD310DRAFT_168884 [Dichomitus squalens]
MTIQVSTTPGSLATEQLRDFFDRLAAGDYHSLAKELHITGRPIQQPAAVLNNSHRDTDSGGSVDTQDPNASIQSIDSVDSFKFKPTADGLHRAVSLIRGDAPQQGAATPEEEDEAFEFTFRLMLHKLYSIKDFAKMVDDVVRSSRENYQPLSPALLSRGSGRRPSVSFAFACGEDAYGDGDSFAILGSPASPSEASSIFPSSDSSWTLDRVSSPPFEDESDARAVKKRIVGRKLSVVDGSMDEENHGPAWVYDSAVASVDSPVPRYESSFSRGRESPSGLDYPETVDGMGYGSRKRRFSFLAARAL